MDDLGTLGHLLVTTSEPGTGGGSVGPVWGHLPQVSPLGSSGVKQQFLIYTRLGSSVAKAEQKGRFPPEHQGQVGLDITDRGGAAGETQNWRSPKSLGIEKKITQHIPGWLIQNWLSGLARTIHWISTEYSELIPPLFKYVFPQGVIAEQSKDDLKTRWFFPFLKWSRHLDVIIWTGIVNSINL